MLVNPLFILVVYCLSKVSVSVCRFDGDENSRSVWTACDCVRLTVDSFKVNCHAVPWITVPAVPSVEKTELHMTSLSVINSQLMFLTYDAFREQSIQVLDLSNNKIDSINVNAFRGLEQKLYQLLLDNNELSRIPARQLSQLQQLRYCNLKNNKIDVIEAGIFKNSILRNLRYLYLDGNLIDSIPSDAFVSLDLQVLTLSHNRIHHMDAHSLPYTIWYISLKGNMLQSIPYEAFEGLKDLQMIDLEGNSIDHLQSYVSTVSNGNVSINLSSNKIRTLPAACFSAFQQINKLDLSRNAIQKVHSEFLQGVATLQTLDLSYNRVGFLPIKSLFTVAHSLSKISLEENELSTVPEALSVLKVLASLNLSSNKLNTLGSDDILSNNGNMLKELLISHNYLTQIAANFGKLENLDLSSNNIAELHKQAFGQNEKRPASTVRLNLAGNQIRRLADPGVFIYMPMLVYVDLSHNNIEHISSNFFHHLPTLESLSLEKNLLDSFPALALRPIVKLRYLILDRNRIRTLPTGQIEQLGSLERISLTHNLIHAISQNTFPGRNFKSLKSINLAFNRITFLASKAFHDLFALDVVQLQGNKLTTLQMYTFANLSNLRIVNLDGNQINYTSEGCFFNLPRLEYLSLRNNRLATIALDAFVHVLGLETLDLAYNKFHEFDSQFLRHVQNLRSLDLSHNMLRHVQFLDHLKQTLVNLNLKNNRLQFIHETVFADMPRLEYLDLTKNSLISLHPDGFGSMPKVHTLLLGDNQLKQVKKGTFEGLNRINLLDVSRNELNRLDGSCFGENNVVELNLAGNRLTEVPQAALASLHGSLASLDLSDNRIESVESTQFEGLRNLSQLLLRANRVQLVSEAAFKSLHKLRILDLSENPIDEWHPNAFRDLSHSLESVNLADTGLYSVPNFAGRAVKCLNLSNNQITSFDIAADKATLQKLQTLDVSRNRLRQLPASMLNLLTNLKVLNVSYNPMVEFTDQMIRALPKLETFHCHHMYEIRDVYKPAFSSLVNLKEFQMYDVGKVVHSGFFQLDELLAVLPGLKTLRIQLSNQTLDNQLANFDTRLLRSLHLQGSNIKQITLNAFKSLRGYKVKLAITNSQLFYLPPQFFSTLNHIKHLYLDLSENRLRTVNPFSTSRLPTVNSHGTVLQDIDLRNNPIHCDCSMRWVADWLDHLRTTAEPDHFAEHVSKWNSTFCYTPNSLVGQSLWSLSAEQFCSASSTAQCSPLSLYTLPLLLLVIFCLIH
ncbi:Chaoptin [Trichinella patagoniensis]|uniref:Chaoptin n=1 Tax=Trichinella patagoniensis TaxID=990121 RepID=A0A0V1AEH7_9BILA|nr:Chaoptin [Trichinella patagoniensis]